MKKPHFYFRAYLTALLMLAAVPAKAADVKELFAIDLADYPGRTLSRHSPPRQRMVGSACEADIRTASQVKLRGSRSPARNERLSTKPSPAI